MRDLVDAERVVELTSELVAVGTRNPPGEERAAATGTRPGYLGMPFTTDARFVGNQAGIPAVVCGPGDIGGAHINDEWVAVERLVDAVASYAELLANFG